MPSQTATPKASKSSTSKAATAKTKTAKVKVSPQTPSLPPIQKVVFTPQELREKLIAYIPKALKTSEIGTFCVGQLRREGTLIITILWNEFGPIFMAAHPEIGNPLMSVIDAAELLITNEFRDVIAGRDMRHKFTTKQNWDENVARHKSGDGSHSPGWSINSHCHFYPMAAFGITKADFLYFRKDKIQREKKPFKKLELRTDRRPIINVPLNISAEMYDTIVTRWPTMTPCTAIRNLLEDAYEKGAFAKANHVIPDFNRELYSVRGEWERVNISLMIDIDDLLRMIGNANEVEVCHVIRSVIHGHDHWQPYLADAKFV